ncbi:MAG: helix-turn-helix transcriptional regulator [Catenibacillus sp.]
MILNYCTAHVHEPLLLEQVAKILHLSKYYISHLFSEKLHMTYGTYIHTLKITEAAKLLEKSDYSVTEVAFASGFNSMRTFNRVFKKYTGVTPQDYRKTVR